MRIDFEYSRNIPAEVARVTLDKDSIQPAKEAVRAAEEVGLGIRIFSYSDVIDDHANALPKQDFIDFCALKTGTAFGEQLKSMFAADAPLRGQSWPNAAIAVVKYTDRIDLVKLAVELGKVRCGGKPVGTLKFMSVEKLGVPRGFLGVNPRCLMVPALFTPLPNETFDPYTDEIYSSWILDQSLRDQSRFCMLVGYNKADALVVVEGQEGPLGDRIDAFFRFYFDRSNFGHFAIADIAERRE